MNDRNRTRTKVAVAVGAELPFDRLVAAVDRWAASRGCADHVVAQTGGGGRRPKHIASRGMIDGLAHTELFKSAELVAHAVMGTIIGALERERPLIVVRRRASFCERRADHRLATVERLVGRGLVHAAADEHVLLEQLDRSEALRPVPMIGRPADGALITAVRKAAERSTT